MFRIAYKKLITQTVMKIETIKKIAIFGLISATGSLLAEDWSILVNNSTGNANWTGNIGTALWDGHTSGQFPSSASDNAAVTIAQNNWLFLDGNGTSPSASATYTLNNLTYTGNGTNQNGIRATSVSLSGTAYTYTLDIKNTFTIQGPAQIRFQNGNNNTDSTLHRLNINVGGNLICNATNVVTFGGTAAGKPVTSGAAMNDFVVNGNFTASTAGLQMSIYSTGYVKIGGNFTTASNTKLTIGGVITTDVSTQNIGFLGNVSMGAGSTLTVEDTLKGNLVFSANGNVVFQTMDLSAYGQKLGFLDLNSVTSTNQLFTWESADGTLNITQARRTQPSGISCAAWTTCLRVRPAWLT